MTLSAALQHITLWDTLQLHFRISNLESCCLFNLGLRLILQVTKCCWPVIYIAGKQAVQKMSNHTWIWCCVARKTSWRIPKLICFEIRNQSATTTQAILGLGLMLIDPTICKILLWECLTALLHWARLKYKPAKAFPPFLHKRCRKTCLQIHKKS